MKFKHGTRRRALEYEKDWVGRWKDDNTFEKSVENRRADNAYVFYDGPPFITGVPHHGTLLSSIVKDAVPRYWTMKGKRVERRWGWDCHGLPAENYVEKQLGITDRRQIVTDKSQPAPLDKDGNELPTISLETYINKARESMVASSETWEGVIDRIGRWVDFKGAYRTMDKDFMESVWWAFKKLYDGGKIYEGEKVLMYDTKFATPVSKAEVTMDNDAYQTVTDPSVYVKFKLKNDLAKSELPRVLFVCQANLGRSQIARGFYNKYTNTDSADSAGVFVDTKFYPGALSLDEVTNERGKPLGSVVVMQEKDIDIAFAKRTQLTPDMVEKYDIVVDLMKDDEERPEWFLSKYVEHWNIDDIGVGQADIRKTRDTIETKVRELANRYAAIDTKSVSLLAWTTTPWTLPANLMLAVNPEMVYCEVLVGDEKLIIAKDALERVLKDEKNQPLKYEVLREFPGSELVGKSYEPLETGSTWPENDKIHKIYAADFVSNESGSGIVHIAPAYGEDDFELAKSYGIAPFHVIDDNGYYTDTNYKGLEVWDNNKFIAKDLKEKGIVWKIEYIRHEYPFNPRSKQRIMYRAIPSWFFDIQGSKPLMLEQNENINWFPEHLKHGRFAKNIEQAPDWNLSRDRFWATAMPVWKGDKGSIKVVGSYAELKELSGVELEDYHRPWVDDIEFDLPYVANQDDDVQIEKLDVFDENGNLTGEVKDRRLIHHDGDWHKAVHIWIINDKDQILLQRRVAWKDSNPNMLDISSAGHVIAGDSSLSAAIRELQEELGLKIKPEDLQFVKRIKKQSKYTPTFINNEFDDMFILKTEKTVSEMKIQKEEVAEVFFVSFEKFREMVEKKDPELLQHTEEFEILFDYFDGKVIPHEELNSEKSGETEHFTRIDKVLDGWFESGSMPFAQMHYPFENREKFEENYPADFIVEYVGQVRAWFYYVHAVNTELAALGAFGKDSDRPEKNAFKNVITTGVIAGNDGRKMSKSLGNFTDPNELMDKFSADSLRFLLLSSPLLNGEDFALHDKDVGDVARKLGMVWNMYDFFTMYAEVDGWEYDGNLVDPLDSLKNPLDIWIVSRVHQLVAEVETYMDEYNIPDALSLVLPFLDDASNWYVRRSRRRFWKSEDDGDKNDAYKTLHYVLVRLSYLLAPFTPFLAEELYHNLTGDSESIHLKNWLPAGNINEKVVADMARTRELITNGLALRMRKDENQDAIKVRQPLAFASYAGNKLDEVYEQIMQEELNVKEIRWIENLDEHLAKYDEVEGKIDSETWIEVSKVLTPELRREGMMREVIRYIQNARKDAGLNVDDRIILDLTTDDDDLKTAIGEFSETIKSETLTENFAPANQYEVSVKVEGRELNIRLAKS